MPETAWARRKPRVIRQYRARRTALILRLGGQCECCGERRQEKLEFHHLFVREWVASALARWSRIRRYEEEADAGLLRLACADCNKRLGRPCQTLDEPDF